MNRPRQVLIVDDEEDVRQTVQHILYGLDCAFTEAEDGATALQIIGGKDFDVVFLDMWLPDLSGIDILRQARALPGTLGRVIVLTGLLDPEAKEETARLGAFRHLTKAPISLAEVRDAFIAALADGGSAPAPPAPASAAPQSC